MKTLLPLAILWPALALAQNESQFRISSVPIVITNPGSYYFASNLSYSDTNTPAAIVIAATNVILDLKRFSLVQTHPDAGGGIQLGFLSIGIWAQTPATVRNGVVGAWLGTGVLMNGGLLENVQVSVCLTGIVAANAIVRRCVVRHASELGMSGSGSRFESCTATTSPDGFGGWVGFYGDESTFIRCKAFYFGYGFSTEDGCVIENSVTRKNVTGILLNGDGNMVRRCAVVRNIYRGITISAGADEAVLEHNVISFSGWAYNTQAGGVFLSGDGARVEHNRIIGNKPFSIYDVGISNVITNNIVRPKGAVSFPRSDPRM